MYRHCSEGGMGGVCTKYNQFTHQTVFVAADVDGNASGGIGNRESFSIRNTLA